MIATERFLEARDGLLRAREDLSTARRDFRWPQLEHFNWAWDYFDVVAAGNAQIAIRVCDDTGSDQSLSFAELADRSVEVASFLSELGIGPGDHVLIMLGNVLPLWEVMLATIRLGAVMIPASTLIQHDELRDRIERGGVKAVIAHDALTDRFAGIPGAPIRITVGAGAKGWVGYDLSRAARVKVVSRIHTRADDLLLLYFTSGTTAKPKLVAHTHASYPIGHLSTMYWVGLKPGDIHLNLSSPGWAKHAWSCFFAPWNAQATVLAYQYERFNAGALLDKLKQYHVTTFCAPPTVWRMLIQQDLAACKVRLREVISAGEPLNPEVIARVRDAWGLTVRDGFGQTETTAQIGNAPGQKVKAGSMGKPLPGYRIVLLDADGNTGDEGELCLDLRERPLGLMQGYLDDAERTATVMQGDYYHTGDVASRDPEGYLTYVGRTDDVFKSSDYRISPFELESVLIEHPAVAEAAVVPSPDPVRLAVPKAFLALTAGSEPDAETARSIFEHMRTRVSAYKRIRRIEFASLPKTISGKIRRVELRSGEAAHCATGQRNPCEFWEEDLRGTPPASDR